MKSSLSEQLTANFYHWEKRGRGWQVWEYPVELEPVYEPFYHRYSPQRIQPPVDDGQKPTLLSSLTQKVKEDFLVFF